MYSSRIKFVVLFLVLAFAFLFASGALLDQSPESFAVTQTGWKQVVAIILWPVRAILIGPLLPFINFLRQDPDTPPPFFLAGFAAYWTVLALVIHYLLLRVKHAR